MGRLCIIQIMVGIGGAWGSGACCWVEQEVVLANPVPQSDGWCIQGELLEPRFHNFGPFMYLNMECRITKVGRGKRACGGEA